MQIGIHVSAAGGVERAFERAHALGCETLQVFTSSPRQWKPAAVRKVERRPDGLAPLVVHANYLVNLAGANAEFHERSREAFRGELERARAVGAEYLVMHPGSAAGGDRDAALERLTASLRELSRGFDWGGLTLLLENTAGGGGQLGGTFEEVATLLAALAGLPVGACIDTCHCWVAGYDVRSAAGLEATLAALQRTVGLERVPVWHVNDAQAERGSRRDRHEHIGEGKLGAAAFRRLLRHPQLQHCAFIAETPVDGPDDQARDLAALWRCAGRPAQRRPA